PFELLGSHAGCSGLSSAGGAAPSAKAAVCDAVGFVRAPAVGGGCDEGGAAGEVEVVAEGVVVVSSQRGVRPAALATGSASSDESAKCVSQIRHCCYVTSSLRTCTPPSLSPGRHLTLCTRSRLPAATDAPMASDFANDDDDAALLRLSAPLRHPLLPPSPRPRSSPPTPSIPPPPHGQSDKDAAALLTVSVEASGISPPLRTLPAILIAACSPRSPARSPRCSLLTL
ncbi:hypothetical protein HYPSUDRAFT_210169, partial [Hypholoma sublateritium FD-334 SS-4]